MGKPSPKATKSHRSSDTLLADRFAENLKAALRRYDGDEKDIALAARIFPTQISRWKSAPVGIRKVSLPIAQFCRVLGIEPSSMWNEECRIVGPVLVDVILGTKPPIE